MIKVPFVFNDFLFLEELCNMKCKYCEGYYKDGINFIKKQDRLIMNNKWNLSAKKIGLLPNPKINDIIETSRKVLEVSRNKVDVPILKISGGEIYLIKEIQELIKQESKNYEIIQVLTNATLLSDLMIDELKELRNVQLQVSLDSPDPLMNKARSQKLTKLVLEKINKIKSKCLPLEINCVLTKFNTGGFKSLLEYTEQYDNTIIIPRPVRGPPALNLKPNNKQITDFEKTVNGYKGHKNLPPYKYLDRVVTVLKQERRSWFCYTPYTVLSSSNLGAIDVCTCSNHNSSRGNLLLNDFKPEVVPFKPSDAINCGNCIMNYEIMNLYIDSELSINDLKRIPLYNNDHVINNINKIKREIIK
ncbi:MAG: radical SAM protein [Candidatus Nanoarchaeia archaeon]